MRTTGDPMLLVSAVRRQVSAIDRNQPVSAIRTMGQRRLIVVLLTSFAGMALLLGTIGIWGVIAYSVAQRNTGSGHPPPLAKNVTSTAYKAVKRTIAAGPV